MIFITNLQKLYGGKKLFDEISFVINPKDRIGLVGKNGAGKSTLLNIIAGKIKPDSGTVTSAEGTTVGYLPQEIKISSKRTVYAEAITAFDEVLQAQKDIEQINQQLAERDDYQSESYAQLINQLSEKHDVFNNLGGNTIESDLEKVLKGLGFSAADFNRPMTEFSGGWQMRVELAKLLLKMPDLLLLDEPTNHLDIESILWLEEFLTSYPGAIMMVSHDKMFLDNITNRTIEIVFGKTYDYKVPYSKYFVLREERLEQQQAAYKNQQRQIAQQEKFIERFRYKATKARQVQSRIKMVSKMEKIEFDELDTQTINIQFPPAPRSGTIVLEGKNLSKFYGENKVLDHINFTIERGEKVAFVGKNGEGKSTLVKVITGVENHSGHLKIGHNVALGYYAQVQEGTLDTNLTVLETIEHEAKGEWSNISRIRGLLGAFLFQEDDVEKKVQVLSGGEKSRLALAKLLLEPVNLLILDEPTNHLDISAKEVLKQALLEYDGTLIVVSHDRDFLQELTDKTYEFSHHKIKEHLGDINDFLKAHKVETFRQFEATKQQEQKTASSASQDDELSNKAKYEQKKQKEKQIRKLKSEIQRYEKEIEKLEKTVTSLEEQMSAPDFYKDEEAATKTIQYHKEQEDLLNRTLGLWDKAVEELDKNKEEN